MKILMQPSLDWKVLILKILTEKKKAGLNCWENLDTLKKLILTDRDIWISILIGHDCQDPQTKLQPLKLYPK